MSEPQPIPQTVQGINAAWSKYRQCSATSVFHKSRLESLTKASLWVGIAGAAIGTAAGVLQLPPSSTESKILSALGSLAVGLAGFLATQALTGDREKTWIRCRGAGEALKSSVYLYCASVPPFHDTNRTNALGTRLEKILSDLNGLELRPGDNKPPPGPLTVEQYMNVRVDDQRKWYTQSADKYQKKADFWRICSFVSATVGIAMAAVSSFYSFSPWVALLATATTSVTAYVKNQRYSQTIALYQATGTRLQMLMDQWKDSAKTNADKPDRDAFILRCEETLSLENGAWTAQWTQPVAPAAPATLN